MNYYTYKRQKTFALVEEYKNSGLSRDKFCQRHGITVRKLASWVTLVNRAEAESTPEAEFIELVATTSKTKSSKETSKPHKTLELEVELPLGVKIRFFSKA